MSETIEVITRPTEIDISQIEAVGRTALVELVPSAGDREFAEIQVNTPNEFMLNKPA